MATTYTADDLARLQAALASGTRKVRYGDREIEYASTAELQTAIDTVAGALARAAGSSRVRQVRMSTQKGFGGPANFSNGFNS